MKCIVKVIALILFSNFYFYAATAQQQFVKINKIANQNKFDITIGNKFFTSFLYSDSLEKPVLYPVVTANKIPVTRGFPLNAIPNEPNDHPHHIGIWFNFENVNGLDFWNNSYAIASNKKQLYGWIKTDKIIGITNGTKGKLTYHANWVNQQNKVLLQETTIYTFSGTSNQRIIDRETILKADTAVLFTDAKDGLLGMRLAHFLQLPTKIDQEFKDDKGNITIVKGGTDTIAKGNYLSSEGRQGDSVWSTRATWCKVVSKIKNDSISIVIIDHPKNINYPTFWHARGYGLFAANPLGEKIFTNNKSYKNLQLQKGDSAIFKYRIVISNGKTTLSNAAINKLSKNF